MKLFNSFAPFYHLSLWLRQGVFFFSSKKNLQIFLVLFQTHAQLKQYLPIIRESPVYPVIYDSNGVVLSLPPIINGNHSKITLNTKNVFIECTATDLTKVGVLNSNSSSPCYRINWFLFASKQAKVVLDTLVCMFSSHCSDSFTTEIVEVVSADGTSNLYPELAYRTEVISPKIANSYIGIKYASTLLAIWLTQLNWKKTKILIPAKHPNQ